MGPSLVPTWWQCPFLFFPGLIVFAPFVNLRLQGQGNQ